MCVCVYVENTVMASSIKIICSLVCACVYVGKVYCINVSIVGRSKKDKKLTLLIYMGIYVCDRKYGPFVLLSLHVRFFLVVYELWQQRIVFW